MIRGRRPQNNPMSSQRARQKPSTSLFFTQRWDRQFIRVRFSQIEATRKSAITRGARLFRCDFSLICHGTARWWYGKVTLLRSLRRSSGLRLFNFDWRHQIDPNEELRIPMGRQSLKLGGDAYFCERRDLSRCPLLPHRDPQRLVTIQHRRDRDEPL